LWVPSQARQLAWDGAQNADGRRALTEAEAVAVVDDDRWGTRIPQHLQYAGTERFTDLPTIG